MPNMTWLADVLRQGGLKVQEENGWQTRGHGEMGDLRGIMLHHTAGPAEGNYPSLNIVRDGDSSLPGPRAQLGLARDGTWIVIAAGLAYHAGEGGPWESVPKDQGNEFMIGIEAESVGTRQDWTKEQLDSYPRGVAALLKHVHQPASRAIGHKEWAPQRKSDPAFWPGDMDGFRKEVEKHLSGQGGDAPAPRPGPGEPQPGGKEFGTWGTSVKVHQEPKLDSPVVHTINGPTKVTVDFQQRGDLVNTDGFSNPWWAHIPQFNGFMTNIFIDHPDSLLPGVPQR
jgi:CubicO group peptidase (beta-lactamase class C family)